MAVYILDNSEELGEKAADLIAKKLNEAIEKRGQARIILSTGCLLYTSPSPRDPKTSRMPSSA